MSYGFIFPGQGSQSVGMVSDLAKNFPSVKLLFEEASDVLSYDLWDIVNNGPEKTLNQTYITQPALLTTGYAFYKVLSEIKETNPAYMAGHSLGEYTALVASNSISFANGIAIVSERGRLMQEAVNAGDGAMAAVIGLENQQVIDVCKQIDSIVEPANFNSTGQVVIAGYKKAVEQAIPLLQKAGAKKVVMLSVSVPSHCNLMKPAADELEKIFKDYEFKTPHTQVLHNVNAQAFKDEDSIKQALIQQLYNPVQWVKTIEFMVSVGINTLYELGPGKILMGLNRRIDRAIKTIPVYDANSLQKFNDLA